MGSAAELLLSDVGLFFFFLGTEEVRVQLWKCYNQGVSVFLYSAESPDFPNRFLIEFGCFLSFFRANSGRSHRIFPEMKSTRPCVLTETFWAFAEIS